MREAYERSAWEDFTAKVRRTWNRLTDADMPTDDTELPQLVAKLQQLYGMSEAEAKEQIRDMRDNLREAARQPKPQ